VGDFTNPLTYRLPIAQNSSFASIHRNRLLWRGCFRQAPQAGRIRPRPPTAAVTMSSACPPLPSSQARHRPRASYGDATVTLRRDYGVVPMWVDPHGNHTVISPGRHRGHTGTAGWGSVIAGGPGNPHCLPTDTSVSRGIAMGFNKRGFNLGGLELGLVTTPSTRPPRLGCSKMDALPIPRWAGTRSGNR